MKVRDFPIYPPSLFSAIAFTIPGLIMMLAGFYIGYKATSIYSTRIIVSLLFLISGVSIGGFGLFSYSHKRKKFLLYEKNQSQPWKIYPFWQSFSLKSQQLKNIFFKITLAISFTLFAIVCASVLLDPSEPMPWYLKLFCIFILLAALAVIYDSIIATLRYIKYGESVLILTQKPLIPGHETDVYIILPKNIKQGTFKIKLYLEEVWKGPDSPEDKTLFEENYSVERKPSDIYQGKPFIKATIAMPEDVKESYPEESHLFEWHIKVSAPASQGIGFETEFLIPVFKVKNEKYIEHNPVKIKT
ncbi:MAG: AtpZ/AtpI family protein [Candidatus Rifleibacteriota bacterium]